MTAEDRRWGWLVAGGGVAFALGAFLPWLSLVSGGITLTMSGMQLNGMQGIFQNHAVLVVGAGVVLAVLGLLMVAGIEARLFVLVVAGLAVGWTVWEFFNVTGGQDRLTGGASVSVGVGLFAMFAGSIAGLAGVLIPEVNRAAAKA